MKRGNTLRRKEKVQWRTANGKENARKNYLYIFFHVVRAPCEAVKQRSQVEQSVRLSVQTTFAAWVRDATDGEEEVDESSTPGRLSRWNSSSSFLYQDPWVKMREKERSPSFRAIKTSGNNWINVKRDENVRRGLDSSKCGSHGEGVRNVLWGTAGEQR